MAQRKVLLTGAGGQLGTDVVFAASRNDAVDLHPFTRAELDITDESRVRETITRVAPEVIIHAAAYTAVDDCETNEQHAIDINGTGTANVVTAAREIGARVMYLSLIHI